jgi:hypothetical protein
MKRPRTGRQTTSFRHPPQSRAEARMVARAQDPRGRKAEREGQRALVRTRRTQK